MARAVDFFFGIMIGVVCAAMIVEVRAKKGRPALPSLLIAMFVSSVLFLAAYVAGS
ncbi:hypothetical protein ACFU5O_09205 [Streptomyces sp. NPDC057445]|uniref:hypothetical protein n=1 Tax=Streptomyces sp. NPDC057445 TaxID=3346136 RepID=UPI00369CA48A